jgi:hypothetical protein
VSSVPCSNQKEWKGVVTISQTSSADHSERVKVNRPSSIKSGMFGAGCPPPIITGGWCYYVTLALCEVEFEYIGPKTLTGELKSAKRWNV